MQAQCLGGKYFISALFLYFLNDDYFLSSPLHCLTIVGKFEDIKIDPDSLQLLHFGDIL